ncbi:MAG: TIGR00730 family Rossman fold protein [Pseudomonadota bacterium]
MRSICVFCGSASGTDTRYEALAERAGAAIAGAGARLVYGGADSGLMGVCARAARDAGGQVLGVIPEFLIPVEGVAQGVEIRRVATLASRKAMMIAEADAFLVLPGGPGTVEEVFDLIAQRRLGERDKPVAFVDRAYWAELEALLETMTREGFSRPALTAGFHFSNHVDIALKALEADMDVQAAP